MKRQYLVGIFTAAILGLVPSSAMALSPVFESGSQTVSSEGPLETWTTKINTTAVESNSQILLTTSPGEEPQAVVTSVEEGVGFSVEWETKYVTEIHWTVINKGSIFESGPEGKEGKTGPEGPKGATGATGATGSAGPVGEGITLVTKEAKSCSESEGTSLLFERETTKAHLVEFGVCNGRKGEKGETGKEGTKGETGTGEKLEWQVPNSFNTYITEHTIEVALSNGTIYFRGEWKNPSHEIVPSATLFYLPTGIYPKVRRKIFATNGSAGEGGTKYEGFWIQITTEGKVTCLVTIKSGEFLTLDGILPQ